MKKDEFNKIFRDFSKKNLSPTVHERTFVSEVYKAFQELLNNCLQIGSFPRFTAIRPLHDLDILYMVGDYDQEKIEASEILNELKVDVESNFQNPTPFEISIRSQTHSVTIVFKDENNDEKFFVDIIPAFISGDLNEFGHDIYFVPEIANIVHSRRKMYYEKLYEENLSMDWIKTDPRGYIEEAKNINSDNPDFRKSVKIVKAWKNGCKEKNENFKLKSFHIEQVILQKFKDNENLEIFDCIFSFFCDLPDFLVKPQIKDRADENRFIDEYLDNITPSEEREIIEARDFFLIKLEKLSSENQIQILLSGNNYVRKTSSEKYLFDYYIPTLTDEKLFLIIDGLVQQKQGSSAYYLRNRDNEVGQDRNIDFKKISNNTNADLYKWKVKNADRSPEPRGEITDDRPMNNPEKTQYIGNHYVECYAIKNNVCVAKARRPVIIK